MPNRISGDHMVGFARHPVDCGIKYPSPQVAIHGVAEINRVQTGNVPGGNDVPGIVVEMDAPLAVPSLHQKIFPGEARDSHLMAAGLGKVDESGNGIFLEQLQIDHVVTQTVLQELAENAPAQTFVVEDQSVEVGLEGKNSGAQEGEIEVTLSGVEQMDINEGVENVVVIEIAAVYRVDVLLVVEHAVQVELEIRGYEDVGVVP